MNISINKMVTISYVLRADSSEGEVIEQTSIESPLKFVFGLGQMLPKFESNLAGLKQGDDFEMQLNAIEAYGEVDNEAIVDLPKDIFVIDGNFDEEKFLPGAQIPMQSSTGQRLNGTVINVGEDSLKMDFNHPLAGIDLHFKGNIIQVREATEEEIMPVGCGCGCSCSSEGEGCSPNSGGGCSDGCGC